MYKLHPAGTELTLMAVVVLSYTHITSGLGNGSNNPDQLSQITMLYTCIGMLQCEIIDMRK